MTRRKKTTQVKEKHANTHLQSLSLVILNEKPLVHR